MDKYGDIQEDALIEFSRRIADEWLPIYCNDPKRIEHHAVEGFKWESVKVSAMDAYDFMCALDHKIVIDTGGGRFRMPQSKANEYMFTHGSNAISPRPLTLWLEPVITIGVMARLHMYYGWPISCLGMQSEDWAFDFVVFKPHDLVKEHIAGEVKKTEKELDTFIANLHRSCVEGDIDIKTLSAARINAHKKWLGLRRSNAPLFWALGPNGYGHIFKVDYSPDGVISLHETTDDQLYYSAVS
ncbi:MAG: hypothetical protein WCL71_05760 [Deltaproteobacteria bacterium]